MAKRFAKRPSTGGIPNTTSPIQGSGHDPPAVGAEAHTGHPIAMQKRRADMSAGLNIPNLREVGPARRGHQTAVWTEGRESAWVGQYERPSCRHAAHRLPDLRPSG